MQLYGALIRIGPEGDGREAARLIRGGADGQPEEARAVRSHRNRRGSPGSGRIWPERWCVGLWTRTAGLAVLGSDRRGGRMLVEELRTGTVVGVDRVADRRKDGPAETWRRMGGSDVADLAEKLGFGRRIDIEAWRRRCEGAGSGQIRPSDGVPAEVVDGAWSAVTSDGDVVGGDLGRRRWICGSMARWIGIGSQGILGEDGLWKQGKTSGFGLAFGV